VWLGNYIGPRKVCKDFDKNLQIKISVHGLKSQNNDINTDRIATWLLAGLLKVDFKQNIFLLTVFGSVTNFS